MRYTKKKGNEYTPKRKAMNIHQKERQWVYTKRKAMNIHQKKGNEYTVERH